MEKYLFIAEKPNTMREYKSVYDKHKAQIDSTINGSIEFTALRGHVFRNLEPKEYKNKVWNSKWKIIYNSYLPMIPDRWELGPIDTAAQTISDLKVLLAGGNYTGIIVGTDSDVEGYGIYYMVMTALKLNKYKTLRFYETSLTERDVLNSFMSMSDLFKTPKHKNATDAYIFRSRWDWLVGMNLSVAYTVRYNNLMKVGSVKAPTLKMIYDNCKAIDDFASAKSYAISADFAEGFSGIMINDDNDKDRTFPNKQDADAVLNILGNTADVVSYKKTHVEALPDVLYSLSDLQVDASKLGYTPDQTLDIAEKLYLKKLLSYPRTACNYLSSGKMSDLKQIIPELASIPELAKFVALVTPAAYKRVEKDGNIINDKEVAKEPHDALIPTGAKIDWNSLTASEKDIYLLVCKRLLAHFLDRFEEEKYVLILNNNGYRFRVNGRKTLVEGYAALYNKQFKDVVIKNYKVHEVLNVNNHNIEERESKPPKRYTSGTIIEAMKSIAKFVTDPSLKKLMKESEGIGTEATRANIITDLQKSKYIELKKNAIHITDAGKKYIESIRKEVADGIYDYGFADPMKVAYWSGKAKEIQLGESKLNDVYDEFCTYLKSLITEIKDSGPCETSYNTTLPAGTKCPCCGNLVTSGKFGWYCSDKCGFAISNVIAGKFLPVDDRLDIINNGRTKKLSGFKAKSGKLFSGKLVLNKELKKLEFNFED